MRLTLPKLLAYLDGALPVAERAAVEECIEHDPQARALLARARRMLEDPARSAAEPPPSSVNAAPAADAAAVSAPPRRSASTARAEVAPLARDERLPDDSPRAAVQERPAERLRRSEFLPADDSDPAVEPLPPGRSGGTRSFDDFGSGDDDDSASPAPLAPETGAGGWKWWAAGAVVAGVAAWTCWPEPHKYTVGADHASLRPAAKGRPTSAATAPSPAATTASAASGGAKPASVGGPAAENPTGAGTAAGGPPPPSTRVAGVYPQPWEYPHTNVGDVPSTPGRVPHPSAHAPAAAGSGMPAPANSVLADPQTQKASLQQPAALGPAGAATEGPAREGEESAETIGTMISSQYPLLRYIPLQSTWKLVAAEERVHRGAMLLAPPHAQPAVALDDGLLLEMLPGTSLELPKSESAPTSLFLMVHFGRLRVTARKPMQTLLLCLDGETVPIVFPHAGATLALETAPLRGDGGDPRLDGVRQQLHLACLREELHLAIEGRERILVAPEQLVQDSVEKRWKPLGEPLPTWTQSQPQSSMDDLRAQKLLVEALLSKLPPEQSLPRMAQDARPAVRVGAARWLGLMGEYGGLAALLDDPQLSPLQRQQVVDELLDGMARGPGWVEHVDQALRLQFGRRGAELFRILQGAADEGKLQEAREVWVPALDDELLAVRVLAFQQLRRLLGAALHYRPEMNAAARRLLVARFQERVERMSADAGSGTP